MLTDDLDARKYAQRFGVPVSGTIGELVLAVSGKNYFEGTRQPLVIRNDKNVFLPKQCIYCPRTTRCV